MPLAEELLLPRHVPPSFLAYVYKSIPLQLLVLQSIIHYQHKTRCANDLISCDETVQTSQLLGIPLPHTVLKSV